MKIRLRIALTCLGAFFFAGGYAQNSAPKLVVGIVVDQMRYDYLYRYYDKYGDDGLKKLMDEGFNCRNNHYNYVPTYTGPGHASVYTGTTPAINGIAGNNWYERLSDRNMYCAQDTSVQTVGSPSSAGEMSPRNLKSSTITDQLRLASNNRAKVVGVALKDRGSILPAGHAANAAYWFDSETGNFISSTWYMNELPQWVTKFNDKQLAKKYLSQTWNTLLPIDEYIESEADEQIYENSIIGNHKPMFPYELSYDDDDYGLIKSTPFGNSLTMDFALTALANEEMGQDAICDFLALSFSSTDYVGHAYGPYAIETEDTYLRLDKEIARLFTYLDDNVGEGNYVLFLTADHGAADVPAFAQEKQLPAGTLDVGDMVDALKNSLNKQFGDGEWILSFQNYQIYLNRDLLAEKEIAIDEVYNFTRRFLLKAKAVYNVVNLHDVSTASLPARYATMIKNGYNPKRSGDLLIMLESNWFDSSSKKGTTHGSFYNYDTHVPLLWYGWKIPQGYTTERTEITDIAPTVAQLLHILEPSGTIGLPITQITDNLED